jgi:hypothetical protein
MRLIDVCGHFVTVHQGLTLLIHRGAPTVLLIFGALDAHVTGIKAALIWDGYQLIPIK